MEVPVAPLDFDRIFEEICLGNAEAKALCFAVLQWFHFIDDVIDGEAEKWPQRAISGAGMQMVFMFGASPFYRAHRATLWPLLLNSARAYLDSESGRHDERMAQVLKSQYQEIFFQVGNLCGGWDHYTAMTARYRQAPV